MDNLVSYNRFTSINPNIAVHGATVEELTRTSGKPDADPVASPMANPAASNVLLSLNKSGSDRMRLADPTRPDPNPYEGPKRSIVLTRNAVSKLRGRVIGQLRDMIKMGSGGQMQERQLESFARVLGMTERVHHYNVLTDLVDANRLSVAKP